MSAIARNYTSITIHPLTLKYMAPLCYNMIRASDAVLWILYRNWPLIPETIKKIERTPSLALITKKYHAILGVHQLKNGVASVKHKCNGFTIIMYYLQSVCHFIMLSYYRYSHCLVKTSSIEPIFLPYCL